jgi:hypothetical protein
MNSKLKTLLFELRSMQEKKLLQLGRSIEPCLTSDDILQPNDFQSLETNPHFRYEEGILHGIQSTEAAIRCLLKELEHSH